MQKATTFLWFDGNVREAAEFYVSVFKDAKLTDTMPGPGGTTIRKGGATYLDVIIHNMEGFSGPITITAEGLPKGRAPLCMQPGLIYQRRNESSSLNYATNASPRPLICNCIANTRTGM